MLTEIISRCLRFVTAEKGSSRPKNLIVQPDLIDPGPGGSVVLMARRLDRGLVSAGGTVIGCSRKGGRVKFVLLEKGSGSFEAAGKCLEAAGTEGVATIQGGEGREEGVKKVLHDFAPDIVLLPSPIEDREAFVHFSGCLPEEMGRDNPVRLLAYELHTPFLPDQVVDITPYRHLKDLFIESGVCVDLSHALSHYRSVTNMRGRGFAEAFVSISPETIADTARTGIVPLQSLERSPIRFFSGFQQLERDERSWWTENGGRERALILSPHFDDETIGCGGTMVRHLSSGDQVAVLFMTDGREGDPGENDGDLVSSLRKKEAIDAMKTIGVKKMEFFDQPETMLMPGAEVENRLKDFIDEFKPDVIYLPSFLDNHIDHVELNRLFYRVVKKIDLDPEIRLFGLWTLIPPNFLVDIGDDYEKKALAINKYRSQIRQVDYLSVTIALNRYWSIKYGDGKGYLETFSSVSRGEYCSMIEVLGIDQGS